MILHSIKHLPTNTLMPSRVFSGFINGGGWTWWEPHETRPGYTPHDPNPRLFYSLQSANSALTSWLLGPLNKQEADDGATDCSLPSSPLEFHFETVPLLRSVSPPRSRSDMQIVTFELLDKL